MLPIGKYKKLFYMPTSKMNKHFSLIIYASLMALIPEGQYFVNLLITLIVLLGYELLQVILKYLKL